MKKVVLMAVIAAFAASPALAATKKKAKMKKPAPVAQSANPNDAGYRLTRDALPSLTPTWWKVLYYSNPANRR
jgi:hypothetical protein